MNRGLLMLKGASVGAGLTKECGRLCWSDKRSGPMTGAVTRVASWGPPHIFTHHRKLLRHPRYPTPFAISAAQRTIRTTPTSSK
jgi:hypothetical protein